MFLVKFHKFLQIYSKLLDNNERECDNYGTPFIHITDANVGTKQIMHQHTASMLSLFTEDCEPGMSTRHKSSRPRRSPPETETLTSPDKTETLKFRETFVALET